MGFAQQMQHKGFAVVVVAFGVLMSGLLLVSAALAFRAGEPWSSAGLPAGFFLLIGSLHLSDRFLRKPTRLRFTRDSTGIRIPVNRSQLRFVFAAGVGLTLPGAWGLCVALATGTTWWPWLIPTAMFAPMILVAARSIARRPTLFLNPNTIEFTGPSSDSSVAWDDVEWVVAIGEPPLEQLNIVIRPEAASWQIHRLRFAAQMGANRKGSSAIRIGEVWARDREIVTVLGPVLDLYRRNSGLRSELLGEGFERRTNVQRESPLLSIQRFT